MAGTKGEEWRAGRQRAAATQRPQCLPLLPPGTDINNMYIYLYIYTSGLGAGGRGPHASLRAREWQKSAPVGAGGAQRHMERVAKTDRHGLSGIQGRKEREKLTKHERATESLADRDPESETKWLTQTETDPEKREITLH